MNYQSYDKLWKYTKNSVLVGSYTLVIQSSLISFNKEYIDSPYCIGGKGFRGSVEYIFQ